MAENGLHASPVGSRSAHDALPFEKFGDLLGIFRIVVHYQDGAGLLAHEVEGPAPTASGCGAGVMFELMAGN